MANFTTLYTPEIAATICTALEDGDSLCEICARMELSEGTVRTWVRDDRQGFATEYARAREIGNDVEFERIRVSAAEEPPRVKGFVDQGWVQWKRNQIDATKWMLARKNKKYGDRFDLIHSGEVDITISERLNAARERLAKARDGES